MTRVQKKVPTLKRWVMTVFAGLAIATSAFAQQGQNEHATRDSGRARPVVNTTDGPVRGLVANGLNTFLGIPYAAPPVGDLRWRPPVPVARHALLDTVKYGNRCAQISTFGVFAKPSMEEDCLYLNVFAPTNVSPQDKHPVMVWIHGGGNFNGASDDYDASKRRCSLYVLGVIYTCSKFAGLRCPLWIPTVFLNCFAPLPN